MENNARILHTDDYEHVYLTLPLQVGQLSRKQLHPRTNVRQSIAQNLHLLLTTSLGEMATEEGFGSQIWESDFDNVINLGAQQESIIRQIEEAIIRYEPRINCVKIRLSYHQDETPALQDHVQIKKKLSVHILATIRQTNEEIQYRDSFFISPLSYL